MPLRLLSYFLTIDDVRESCTPVFSDSTSLKKRVEENEKFFLTEFNGTMTFSRFDFDRILAANFGSSFEIEITLNGFDKFRGVFQYTDFSKWDEDNRKVELNMSKVEIVGNEAQKITDNKAKEFDVPKLSLKKHNLIYYEKPVIQIYLFSSNIVTNIISGVFVDIPVVNATQDAEKLQNEFHFFEADTVVAISGGSDVLDPPIGGLYIRDSFSVFTRTDGMYRAEFIEESGFAGYVVKDLTQNDLIVYRRSTSGDGIPHGGQPGLLESETTDSVAAMYFVTPYIRLLSNRENIGNTQGLEILENDLAGESNYKYAYSFDPSASGFISNIFILNFDNSETKTEWGRIPDYNPNYGGRFYTNPNAFINDSFVPIATQEWGEISYWFRYDADLSAFIESLQERKKILDFGYNMAEVVQAIFDETGIGVTYADNVTHSRIFHDERANLPEYLNRARHSHIITPKSNWLKLDYTEADTSEKLTLNDIFNFWRSIFNAYYHVDDQNRLIVEHLRYYELGRTYDEENPIVAFDLVGKLEPKHELPWSYRSRQYEYEKDRLPERVELKWPDFSSRFFEGRPIESLSPWSDKGNIKTLNVTKFSPEIELALAFPSLFNSDGFFVFHSELVVEGGVEFYKVQQSTVGLGGLYPNARVQNGYLSFVTAADKYHRHGFGGDSAKINLTTQSIYSVAKSKKQQIQVYEDQNAVDNLNGGLGNTTLGRGEITEIDESLTGGTLKITILHETIQ